jgi:hypothetical protein
MEKMAVSGHYECSGCRHRLKEGEFMAIIGKAPPESLSTPIGRADAVFKQVGEMYCSECFFKRFAQK